MGLSIVPAELLRPGAVPRPGAIDVPWLEAMLHRAGHAVDIAGFDIRGIGTGQIGEAARIALRYNPTGRQGPATLVGKFSSENPTSLKVAENWRLRAGVHYWSALALATPSTLRATSRLVPVRVRR